MKSGRFNAWCVGTCLVVALGPTWAAAQTTTATTPIATAPSGTTNTVGQPGQSSTQSTLTQPPTGSNIRVPLIPTATVEPISYGIPTERFGTTLKYPKGIFGKTLYTATTTTAGGGGAGAAANQKVGFTTYGTPRSSVYSTVLADDLPLVVHKTDDLFVKVKAVIDRSSYLPSKGNIQISMEGTTVQLQGQVGSEKERRTAEGMVRMTPGVRVVENQLQVVELKK